MTYRSLFPFLVLALTAAFGDEVNRAHLRVDAVQKIDTSIFPPSQTWMTGKDNTGEGIWIGIYDEPIDTTQADFREDSNGVSRFRGAPVWDKAYGGDHCCPHGTSVASIAAGNGWLSESSGGTRYQWRGIAYKSSLVSGVGDGSLGEGDVNNHSSLLDAGSYSDLDRHVDSVLFNHKAYRHAVVYAAGNNGDRPAYGVMQGYYSILTHAKNPINVGAVYTETDAITPLSSMGPTLDGRIKPDVVAPGASYFFPPKAPTPLKVYIDSIVIRNPKRTLAWRFHGGLEGWKNEYRTESLAVDRNIFHFNSIGEKSWIKNAVSPLCTTSTDDTLILGYKLVHPDFPGTLDYLQCGLTWNHFSNDDSLLFNLPAPDTNRHEARFPLSKLWGYVDNHYAGRLNRWRGGIELDSLWIGFHSDSVLGIRTLAVHGTTLGNYVYNQGTSEAVPQVTGVIALMLQSYVRKGYLKPGQNIHQNAPWNSTLKALLIHTATDLVKRGPSWTEKVSGGTNPDLLANESNANNAYTRYYPGPDYATGYGLVNAQKALDYVDTARFKQCSLTDQMRAIYAFQVPRGAPALRATLAWDDYEGDAGHPFKPQLVNDLDLILVSPVGKICHPWVLNPLPQNGGVSSGIDPIHASDIDSAYRGVNDRDNVEVVDVPKKDVVAGTWKLIVQGTRVPHGPQDFSVVSDFALKKLGR